MDRDVRWWCFGASHSKPVDNGHDCNCARRIVKLGVERKHLHLVPGMEIKFSKHGGWWTLLAFRTAELDLVVGTARIREEARARRDVLKVRSKRGDGWQVVEVFDA